MVYVDQSTLVDPRALTGLCERAKVRLVGIEITGLAVPISYDY